MAQRPCDRAGADIMRDVIRIVINGQPATAEDNISVQTLVDDLARPKGPCAVERNGQLVPWTERSTTAVQDGDQIEVVTLVGGG